MRIVFMGTAAFGTPTLRALQEHHEVAAVVTLPDRRKGRGRKMIPTPVRETAEELHLPLLIPDNLNDPSFIDSLKSLDADLFFIVAFRILPAGVFTIPPKGTVNLHTSLLPDYRGAAPINHAVINGDASTGLTTFFIDKKVDTGDILFNTELPIGPDETAGELHDRMMVKGAELALKTVNAIESGAATAIQQPKRSPRPAPKLFRDDGRIEWNGNARTIHNKIRGMNPAPGAFTDWTRGPLKILRTKLIDTDTPGTPGLIVEASPQEGPVISCGQGSLRIVEVQPPGKKPMDGASFVRGYRIEPGQSILI